MMREVTPCAETRWYRAVWPLMPPNRTDLPAELAITVLRLASPPRHLVRN
jgi:hypothetical protein